METGNFWKDETKCAMFMLCESIVWTCLFRPSGIPVPHSGAMQAPHFFFVYCTSKNILTMRKIKLYIAASIDGYIAGPDGELDWLSDYPITPELNYGYKDFFDSIDTVVMGGRTYRDILNMGVIYPYKDKTSYIITRNAFKSSKEDIIYITNNIENNISELKKSVGKDIWLVGGGETVSLFLNQNWIDEMIITYIPILLGEGIRLFPNKAKESKWSLIQSQTFINGVVQTRYQVQK